MSFLKSRLLISKLLKFSKPLTLTAATKKNASLIGTGALGFGCFCYFVRDGYRHRSPFVLFAQEPRTKEFDVDDFIHEKLEKLKGSIAEVVREVIILVLCR